MLNQNQLKEVTELFEIGAHLGHKKSRLHPKAKKNVYKIVNGTSVIDLSETVLQIEKAHNYLKEAISSGKKILIVGTKKNAALIVKDFCEKNSIPYVATKWLPGLLTNFKTIMQNVKKMQSLKEELATESTNIKHEKVKMQKEASKLERLYGGFSSLTAVPDVLVVIDTKKEKNAVKEAQSYNIPIIGILDTNSNPEEVNFPVVCNDDTSEVIAFVLEKIYPKV